MKIINNMIVNLICRAFAVLVFLVIPLSLSAQNLQKKHLTEPKYSQWGTLNTIAISDSGKWASYKMTYDNTDTTFVQSTFKNNIYTFPKGRFGQFSNGRTFACILPGQGLKLVDLDLNKSLLIPDVARYRVIKNGKYIVTLDKTYGVQGKMHIRDKAGIILDSIDGVTEYELNADESNLAYASSSLQDGYSIGIINFTNYSRTPIATKSIDRFHTLKWQKNGNAIAFFRETDSTAKSNAVCMYRIPEKKMLTFEPEDLKNFSTGMHIVEDLKLDISDDGSKLFFGIRFKPVSTNAYEGIVEIWNGNDPWVYPMEKSMGDFEHLAKLAVWFPAKGAFYSLTTANLPFGKLTGKQEYMLSYNPKAYAPHYKGLDGDADFYLTDIEHNTKLLLLKQHSGHENNLGLSPIGNQLAYYVNSNWWVYQPDKKSHINLTKNIPITWDTRNNKKLSLPILPYGKAGWSVDGNYILLYDAYDIWCMALDGSTYKRLTHGREKQIVFRLSQTEFTRNSAGKILGVFDLTQDLVLEAKSEDDCTTGYYIWNKKNGESPLAFENSAVDQLQRSKNNSFIYREQKYDRSPRIEFKPNGSDIKKELYASNPQQKLYNWGKSELIHYSNNNGEHLKGALFYPSDYDKEKKYPMVVHIYQTRSGELNQYVNPSLYNEEGINITNLSQKGYFVLLPDIAYEIGDPGPSATACVTAAIKTVTDMGLVDAKKIGLIGHSFGGYETNFILTQNSTFAAAVSGAGISDIIAWYFTIGEAIEAPGAWRFENQQWRMGKSFYEDKNSYLRNSPIFNASNIKTPLLIWTGKEDKTVTWQQSVAFHIALRRLEKKNILLVYPEEDHAIFNKENQKDLTRRVEEWFDYYLKDEKPADWISKGTK